MSVLLASLRVAPLYGQVVVESEGATDLPIPETGHERIVASSESLLVATRGDQEGDVLMEVWRGVPDAERAEPLFDGELSFTVPRLVFGSSLGAQLTTVETGQTGWVAVKVFADPEDAPSRVVVAILWPVYLNIGGNPAPITQETRLSELLQPNMDMRNWAACREVG